MKLRWEDTVEDRAHAVVECWEEDLNDTPNRVFLTLVQRRGILHQVAVAIHAQRNEYHVEGDDVSDFRKLVQKIIEDSKDILKGLE